MNHEIHCCGTCSFTPAFRFHSAAILPALFLCLWAAPAPAATFIPSDTLDSTNVSSLRGAIIAANEAGGTNVILLTNSTYRLTIGGASEDAGLTGDLDITNGNLSILGASTSIVTVTAAGLGDRVLHILPGAEVTLSNLLITGGTGFCNKAGLGQSGGGIYNAGTLNLTNCIVLGNSSGPGSSPSFGQGGDGGQGGGIYSTGTLMLSACVVSSNASGAGGTASDFFGGNGGYGGGIWSRGPLTLRFCTVSDNTSGAGGSSVGKGGHWDDNGPTGGDGGRGAGIYSEGSLTVEACTISSNRCGAGGRGGDGSAFLTSGGYGGAGGSGGSGGGIYCDDSLFLLNSTISGNSTGLGGAGGAGGGLSSGGPGGAGGRGGHGGGVYCDIPALGFGLYSCTISYNCAQGGGAGGSSYSNPGPGGDAGFGGGFLQATAFRFGAPGGNLIALNTVGTGGAGGIWLNGTQTGAPGADGRAPDLAGEFYSSRGFNLIGQADGSSRVPDLRKGDLAGTPAAPLDPRLGPLQLNGGLTATHALLAGSPAIDKGTNYGMAIDQRGYARPHDYASILNATDGDGSDIGAFESDAPILCITRMEVGVAISWETNCLSYTLETTTNLGLSSGWLPISATPEIVGAKYQVSNTPTAGNQFFRLRSN